MYRTLTQPHTGGAGVTVASGAGAATARVVEATAASGSNSAIDAAALGTALGGVGATCWLISMFILTPS